MARLGGFLLLGFVTIFIQASVAEYSHDELYSKLKRLFEDTRVSEVAEEVKRDMREEEDLRSQTKKSDLLTDLVRALSEKDDLSESKERKEYEERLEEERREYLESRNNEERNEDEDSETSLLRRLVSVLRDRKALEDQPWFYTKPAQDFDKESYDKCYMTKTKGAYGTQQPFFCKYLEKDYDYDENARLCKGFCDEWSKQIQDKNNDKKDKFCPFDDRGHIEGDCGKVTCDSCMKRYGHRNFCCGSCLRLENIGECTGIRARWRAYRNRGQRSLLN